MESSKRLIGNAIPIREFHSGEETNAPGSLYFRDADPFSEDKAELRVLQSKPTCFWIVGKPGVGKTTLAKLFAQDWKCELVSATELISRHMEKGTELGKECSDLLSEGNIIPEELVFRIIEDKMLSPEVAHHGYIMDDLLCVSESTMTITDQMAMIKKWRLQPDFIIILEISDEDLLNRRHGLKADPVFGRLYSKDMYSPEKPVKQPKGERALEEEEEEAEEEEDEENEAASDEEAATELPQNVVQRLVTRPEDMDPRVEETLNRFHTNVSGPLHEYIQAHDHECIINLDGNLPSPILAKQLQTKLQCYLVSPAAVVRPLKQASEEEEDEPDESYSRMNSDELMRALASKGIVAPKFRWRRSRWLQHCPVQLYDGKRVLGKPKFAVSFLDKMYLLSSANAMDKFMKNPRPYLLPPQPRPPCKLAVVGPPLSGKSTLSNILGNRYSAQVLDVEQIIQPQVQEEKQKLVELVRDRATIKAIEKVTQQILKEKYDSIAGSETVAGLGTEQEPRLDVSKLVMEELEKAMAAEEAPTQEEQAPSTPKREGGEQPKEEEGEATTPTQVGSETETPRPRLDSSDSEIDANHPEVAALVEEAVLKAEEKMITLPSEDIVEIVQTTVGQLEQQRHKEHPESPEYGGWILDDFPNSMDLWKTCLDQNLIPDTVVILGDDSPGGLFLAQRYFDLHYTEVTTRRKARLKREKEELQRQMEEMRRKKEEEERAAEEEFLRMSAKESRDLDEIETPRQVPEVEVPEAQAEPAEKVADGADNPEKNKEDIEKLTEKIEEDIDELPITAEDMCQILGWPEMAGYLEQRLEYEKQLNALQASFSDCEMQMIEVDISEKTVEQIAEEAAQHLEKQFIYQGWEYSLLDMDEEDEDREAEIAALEDESYVEEEEILEEEEEDSFRNTKKMLGDSSFFCPVALKESRVLFPGSKDCGARYREKLYFLSSAQARESFLQNPPAYLPTDQPLSPPPLRLLVVGLRGSGKTTHGLHLAEKLGLLHISFRERLQELILPKTKVPVVPLIDEYQFEEEEEEEEEDEEKEEEGNLDAEIKPDSGLDILEPDKTTSKENKEEEEEEVELTEAEDMIRQSIISSEPLSDEILDTIVPQWWKTEPFCSKGFVLEGFPRVADEVKYLADAGLYPDAVLLLSLSEEDMVGRLLPPRMEKWRRKRDKRLRKRAAKKEKARKKLEAAIQKRREELLQERAQKAAKRMAQEEEGSDEDYEEEEEEDFVEEEEEDIEAILAEEFEVGEEELEEEEDEETEADMMERIMKDLDTVYSDYEEALEPLLMALEDHQVYKVEVDAGRKPHIVRYLITKHLKQFVEYRRSIFERVYPLTEKVAEKLLRAGHKQLSRFGRWCPVKLLDGDNLPQSNGATQEKRFPCLYRQYIYFLHSSSAHDAFLRDPLTYLQQRSPGPTVPIHLAIIGPPKAGKSTLAKRFAEDYGVLRLSVGEAMRIVLQTQPQSTLAQRLKQVLCRGLVVPEELQVQALERVMLDIQCQTNGYVLDGYPITARQAELLEEKNIVPALVIHLDMEDKEVLSRGVRDRASPTRTFPMLDNDTMLQCRTEMFRTHVDRVVTLYTAQHRNVVSVNPTHSKWWVWSRTLELTQAFVAQRQAYRSRWMQGKAASVADLGISPQEIEKKLGEVGHYCPVSLARGLFVDGSTTTDMKYVAEFLGLYYKMAGDKELQAFLSRPEQYLAPLAPCRLPEEKWLPKRRHQEDLQQVKPVELHGYCPVTFLDGKLRYEALESGNPELIVEYLDKFYYLESEEKLKKFMRTPEKYSNLQLPRKLPPGKAMIPLTGLPMLGYLEQGVSSALITALTATGTFKPKYPFQSATRSALLYTAYHLKAFNPKSSMFLRRKYKQKLKNFEEMCKLIRYLGDNMPARLPESTQISAEFSTKVDMFWALKTIEPTTSWIV